MADATWIKQTEQLQPDDRVEPGDTTASADAPSAGHRSWHLST